MKTFSLTLVLVAAVTVAAISPRADVRVVGTVVEATSGALVSGARLSITGHPNAGATSDNAGAFSIDLTGSQLIVHTVELRVEAAGFIPHTQTVTLSDSVVSVTVTLAPAPLVLEDSIAAEADQTVRVRRESRAMNAPAAMAQMSVVGSGGRGIVGPAGMPNRESYAHIEESGFLTVASQPLSTFSIDVDRASYSNVRRFINAGQRPPIDAVRIEELINYFPYEYDDGDGEHPFGVTTEVMAAPWNDSHLLARVGLQGQHVDFESAPPSNLVFLLDVSGSMGAPDKLPLLKQSLRLLVNELRDTDRVAIVVYAGSAGLVLPSTPGTDKQAILDALLRLESGGSTAGGAGIRLAYRVARENFIEGGNNRVILATDGDFNVGASSDSDMIRLIEDKRREGTFLTVLGFGAGNLQDAKMEQIADHGNGNFAYIDNLLEARKVLVTEMGGTLLTIAKDVKLQVEFNPAELQAYRLIGYENRLLAAEDFNNDEKDAGELGAGHSVTALYEIVPHGVDLPAGVSTVDSLRYQPPAEGGHRTGGDELFFVKVRYKAPDGNRSRLVQLAARAERTDGSHDLRFAAAVAGFGMILRESEHAGNWTLADVTRVATGALGEDRHGYRADFLKLVERLRQQELVSTP